MLFNSSAFLIFFPIVVVIYFVLPQKLKNLWLLIASYYFYMCWNAQYAILILMSTVVTYGSGLLMDQVKNSSYHEDKKVTLKKLIVTGSFIINLGILFYFKYLNFLLETIGNVLARVNINLNISTFDILLPVGISFYTFQALSYTMDVYRDDICAEKNFLRYALFVSFFPQLVAGPIERSKNLIKQLSVPKPFDFLRAREGFLLMIWGYFLKLVISDRVAIFVDAVYKDHDTFKGWYIILATILFAVQIYCDFSGYSTIAMGAAKILGIELMDNFNAPYLSTSVADFWRKWHISLTSWFKDYLYIPLGGSRKGQLRKYLNKLIVFLISGLWHGANLSFVIWGGINGLYQIAGEILQPFRDKGVELLKLNRNSLGHKLFKGIITFILVDFSWIFFRASGFRESFDIIRAMITVHNPWILMDGSLYTCGLDSRNFLLLMLSIGVLIMADICKTKGIRIRSVIAQQDYWCRHLIILFSICFILVFGIWGSGYDAAGFIYFQF